MVAKTAEEALVKAQEKSGCPDMAASELKQDEDVIHVVQLLDLAHSGVRRIAQEEEVAYYYPTNDLVTAPEIMSFWVARMIISGYHYRGGAQKRGHTELSATRRAGRCPRAWATALTPSS